jgi:hypothetical protein
VTRAPWVVAHCQLWRRRASRPVQAGATSDMFCGALTRQPWRHSCTPGRWAWPGCRRRPQPPAAFVHWCQSRDREARANNCHARSVGRRTSLTSTSTLINSAPGYWSAISTNIGAMRLHGPHHVAVKSTTTGCARRRASSGWVAPGRTHGEGNTDHRHICGIS